MANATAFTAEQMDQIAAANPTLEAYKSQALAATQENYSYGSPLAADTYRSVVDEAGKLKMFGFDEAGNPLPAICQVPAGVELTVNGVKRRIAFNEQYLTPKGEPKMQTPGYILEASNGTQVKLHKSILDRLVLSADPADVSLVSALTRNGAHSPFFSGASKVAIQVEKPEGRKYGTPRLVETK